MMNIKIKFNNLTLYFLLIALLCGYIKNALVILLIVFSHEMGHIIMSLLLGYKVKEVELYPFGGITKLDKLLNSKITHDLLISLAGIFVQVIIFLLCKIGYIQSNLIYNYNLSIMLFNLLPIIPLDGSKIIFELLNYKLSYKKSLVLYIFISSISIVLYFLINYKYELNNYMIVILFICKTIEYIKNYHVIYHKFILERFLYNIKFSKVQNSNQKINKYHKDIKYYYNINNHIIEEKDYLKQTYKL